jgi:hypothetical protein
MTIKECEEGYHLFSSCHVCPFLLVKLLGYDKETFSILFFFDYALA